MPKFNIKKKNILRIKVFTSLLVLFILSVSFLILAPSLIEVAKGQVFLYESEFSSNNVQKEIVGVKKTAVLKVVNTGKLSAPQFSAASVLAKDLETGEILYEKNIDSQLSPASTTKLMTALVALEHYKPDDVLTVSAEDLVGGSTMGLEGGEQLTFRSLLYGMLLNSGNDASFTLASNYPGGFDVFISKMNEKAKELNLTNTHFENPAGFDGPFHYSSTSDLAKLALNFAEDPELKRVVSTKETSVSSIDNSRVHYLKNLNKLLGENGVYGIKTGFTEKSGENLVGLVERDGHKILTVVLNSTDRFGETKALMDFVFGNFKWKLTTT